jgi:FHA domain
MAVPSNCPVLTIQSPKGIEKLELTAQETWTFGRSPKNRVRIDDPFASRYHVKLHVNRSQHCYVVDLSSRNGTLLNDEPLLAPVWLKHGDRLSIGETTICYEDGRGPMAETPLEDSPVAVIMVQESKPQGKIWQEIFLALSVNMLWNDCSATLKQTLEARDRENQLPKVLLIDVSAFHNLHHFCRWCYQTYPQIQIFLLDSVRKEIPSIERQIAIKNSAKNFFPAMNRHNLVLRSAERLRDINQVLEGLGSQPLSQQELLTILRRMSLQN